MEKEKLNTLRIRLLCNFLNKGGGTLQEMLNWINNELENLDQEPIGLRTLQTLIELLRNGEFIHSLQDLDKKRKAKLFKVNYRNKIYEWDKKSKKPEFGDLEEDERYTLPFIVGMLKKYESLPAVRKILDILPDVFSISEKEMKSASVIYNYGATLYHTYDESIDEKVIKTVVCILGHINRKEMIEFMYSPVSIQDDSLQSKRYHKVSPLHIRYYNDLYYLTAIDVDKERIVNYRIDQILNFKIDSLKDEDDKVIHFDPIKLEKKYRLKEHFKYVLGIWNHHENDKVYEIHVKFKEWAAAYMSKLKFHHSQKTICVDKKENSIIISFTLKLGPEKHKNQKADERSPELNFLLGRFRDYAEIVNVKLA
jgi:hypothetical protein